MEQEPLVDIIENGAEGFPLTIAYKNGHRYYTDFIEMMDFFKNRLSKKEYKDIEKKILSGSSQTDEQSYLQCMSELVILYYVMRRLDNSGSFKYEPKYNGGFNPECSFICGGKTVNIEVKCPHMGKRIDIESHDTLKITLAERVPNNLDFTAIIKELNQIVSPRLEKQGYSSVEVIPRMDNKLKDYLEHSQKKFPSGDSYFNILVISLEILQDMDEWYGYLLGDNGAFTPNSYIKTCYDNVDAVLLCTPICGLKGWKHYSNINVWKLEETLNLLFLDPRKECIKGQDQLTEKGKFYRDYGMYMFGALTEPFLLFQQKLDSENEGKFAKLSFQERYIAFKEKDIRICSAFVENLIEQQSSAL